MSTPPVPAPVPPVAPPVIGAPRDGTAGDGSPFPAPTSIPGSIPIGGVPSGLPPAAPGAPSSPPLAPAMTPPRPPLAPPTAGPMPVGGIATPAQPASAPPSAPPLYLTGTSGPAAPIQVTPSRVAGAADPTPSKGRSWWGALVLGALIGAIVASIVSGAIWTASDRSQTIASGHSSLDDTPTPTVDAEPLDIGAILDQVRPSVVSIRIDANKAGEAAGSGIVIDDVGTVLTNYHVIESADGRGTAISIEFSDGEVLPAQLVGSFPDQDVAVIRTTTAKDTTPAEFGSSDALQVGEDVIAIGNALNLGAQPSVTKGIVSALNRSLTAEGVTLDHLIQTDAAINPGNSGGALVNSFGQVVGINTAIIQNSQSIGFALSIDAVKPLIEDILAGNGDVDGNSPFLGVMTVDVSDQAADVLERFGVTTKTGAFVTEVTDGTAAAAAGMMPGDVIVEVEGEPITTNIDVGTIIRRSEPGDTISIVVERRGERTNLEATLGRRGG